MNASRVRIILLVTLVTAIVWVYADAESVRTDRVGVRLSFGSDTPQIAMRVAPGQSRWTGEAEVVLKGGNAAVDRVRAALRPGVRFVPGDAGVPAASGPIDLREALRRSHALEGTGVAVAEVSPADLLLDVVTLRQVVVPVQVAPLDGLDFGSPFVNPSSVTLWLPADLTIAEGAAATARPSRAVIDGVRAGQAVTLREVAISAPEDLAAVFGVRLEPAVVEVTLTVRAREAMKTIPTVPVQVQIAPTELDRWDVAINPEDRLLQNARLTGPAEVLARIGTDRASEFRLLAVVMLSFEELEQGVRAKDAELIIVPPPPGIVRVEAGDRRVRLTVTPRGGMEPRPPAGVEPEPGGRNPAGASGTSGT